LQGDAGSGEHGKILRCGKKRDILTSRSHQACGRFSALRPSV
jgi:hypothetical protein